MKFTYLITLSCIYAALVLNADAKPSIFKALKSGITKATAKVGGTMGTALGGISTVSMFLPGGQLIGAGAGLLGAGASAAGSKAKSIEAKKKDTKLMGYSQYSQY